MIARLVRLTTIVSLAYGLACASALAHPHVWVTMTSELVYAPDGAVTAVRQAWTFDDMYSEFAVQGLESKEKGVFTREELAPLAEVNVTSLKEFDYFTYAKASGKKTPFVDPTDYWLEYRDSLLTLHFTLSLKAPVKTPALVVEIYDPSYFIDFAFADDVPVKLSGAPAQCKFNLHKPTDGEVSSAKRLDEAMFADATNYGAMFANKVSVICP
jgi:ABC-type uncharacterized transport system substrate-binding protein